MLWTWLGCKRFERTYLLFGSSHRFYRLSTGLYGEHSQGLSARRLPGSVCAGLCWLCGRLIPNLPPPLDAFGSNHAAPRRIGQGWTRVKCSRKYNFLVVGVQPQGPDSLQPIFKIWIHAGQVSLKWEHGWSEFLKWGRSPGWAASDGQKTKVGANVCVNYDTQMFQMM